MNFLGIFWEFFGNFLGIFWEFYGNFMGISSKNLRQLRCELPSANMFPESVTTGQNKVIRPKSRASAFSKKCQADRQANIFFKGHQKWPFTQ